MFIDITMNDLHVEIYKCIEHFIKENGYAPSYRQLINLTSASSVSTINRYLGELRALEYIDFVDGVSRSMRVVWSLYRYE